MIILSPFPDPPPAVSRALEQHAIARRGHQDEIARAEDLTDLPRPWDPARCPSEFRKDLWIWCDEVAKWINREYIWRPSQLIPPCWPRHPHIARELPALAIQRWNAERSDGPEALEEWHRQSFPQFLDRLLDRLGDGGCRTGKHADWPAESRYLTYTSPNAVADRKKLFFADTKAPGTTTSAEPSPTPNPTEHAGREPRPADPRQTPPMRE